MSLTRAGGVTAGRQKEQQDWGSTGGSISLSEDSLNSYSSIHQRVPSLLLRGIHSLMENMHMKQKNIRIPRMPVRFCILHETSPGSHWRGAWMWVILLRVRQAHGLAWKHKFELKESENNTVRWPEQILKKNWCTYEIFLHCHNTSWSLACQILPHTKQQLELMREIKMGLFRERTWISL